jgi:rhodanese-related sulfurtransferase
LKEEFVRLLTAEMPERPGYFAQDAELNRSGAPALTEMQPLPELTAIPADATALDTRPSQQFFNGHIPGAVHIALGGQYASFAATILGLDKEIVLIAEDEEHLEESRMRLARVGIERIVGTLKGGMAQWTGPVQEIHQISVEDLRREMDHLQVVDVRREPEFAGGHIEGAKLMPLHKLESLVSTLDHDRPIAVHCKGGYRSAVACSLIQRAGYNEVMNVMGGFDAWLACGLPSDAVGAAH